MTDPTTSIQRPAAFAPFSLRGRLGRVEFVAGSVALALGGSLLVSALGFFLLAFPLGLARTLFTLATVGILYVLLPVLAAMLAVRRLHDIGKPGWLVLLLLVPLANILFTLVLAAWPGTAATNVFGPARPPASTPALAAAVALPLLLVAAFLASNSFEGLPAHAPEPTAAASPPVSPSDTLKSYRP